MCEPTAYDLVYEINPWMHISKPPDRAEAWHQWMALHHLLKDTLGCTIELIRQIPGCPDMVFTANGGLVLNGKVILPRFRFNERRSEEPHFRAFFESLGLEVCFLGEDLCNEGEGDALFAGNLLVLGHGKRTTLEAHAPIAEALDTDYLSVRLIDGRWYHLDTCFLPLRDDLICFYPGAFDAESQSALRKRFQTLEVSEAEALRFACNAVVIQDAIVMPTECPVLADTLRAQGYRVFPTPMSEFMKAGGACKCLTLYM